MAIRSLWGAARVRSGALLSSGRVVARAQDRYAVPCRVPALSVGQTHARAAPA